MKDWLIKILGGYTREKISFNVRHDMPNIRGEIFQAIRDIFSMIDERYPERAPKKVRHNQGFKQLRSKLAANMMPPPAIPTDISPIDYGELTKMGMAAMGLPKKAFKKTTKKKK